MMSYNFFSEVIFLSGHGLVAILFFLILLVCTWLILNKIVRSSSELPHFHKPHFQLLYGGLATALVTLFVWVIWVKQQEYDVRSFGRIGFDDVLTGDPIAIGVIFTIALFSIFFFLRLASKDRDQSSKRMVAIFLWLLIFSFLWLGLIMNLYLPNGLLSNIHYLKNKGSIQNNSLICYNITDNSAVISKESNYIISKPDGWVWYGHDLWQNNRPECSDTDLPRLRNSDGLVITFERTQYSSFKDVFESLRESHPGQILYVRDEILPINTTNKLVIAHPENNVLAEDPLPAIYIQDGSDMNLLRVTMSEVYESGSRKAFVNGQKQWYLQHKDELISVLGQHLSQTEN